MEFSDISFWNKPLETISKIIRDPQKKSALALATQQQLERLAEDFTQSQDPATAHRYAAIQEKFNQLFPETPIVTSLFSQHFRSPLIEKASRLMDVEGLSELAEELGLAEATPAQLGELIHGLLINHWLDDSEKDDLFEELANTDAESQFFSKMKSALAKVLEGQEPEFQEKMALGRHFAAMSESLGKSLGNPGNPWVNPWVNP